MVLVRLTSVIFTLLFGLQALMFSCNMDDSETQPGINDDVVFHNGNIYTVNSAQPWVEAIVVDKDGVITFVGSSAEALDFAPGAEVVNLQGKFVMPGLHDVHLHPLEASTENFQFILDDTITDPEEYAADVERAIAENSGDGWLLGWGHWIDVPLNATRAPKEILDDLAPNRPVAIMEQTSHSVWCNSKALELIGIENTTPNPAGGIIMREANGDANGLLIDNAGNMLLDIALVPTAISAQNDYQGLLEYGLPELAKFGITSISDARTYWKREHHKTWQKLAVEDNLTVRVNLGLWAYPAAEDAAQIANLKSLYSNSPESLLKINQIKVYADGIIHNTTSAMHNDYLIDYFDEPTNNGLNYFTEERMAAYISQLESTGFDFHIHGIGNRGIHEALNAIELAGTNNGRHRITHVEYISANDMNRFAALNVTADAQVAGDFTQPQNWHHNDYLIGSALNQSNIPLKSLTNAGARLTLSSDWDVSALNPFVDMQNAVTRTPQNISLEDAIKAYTINSAYVMRQEHIVGSLEVGKEADFIVLDRNLFDIPANQINITKVLETYLQGEKVN